MIVLHLIIKSVKYWFVKNGVKFCVKNLLSQKYQQANGDNFFKPFRSDTLPHSFYIDTRPL